MTMDPLNLSSSLNSYSPVYDRASRDTTTSRTPASRSSVNATVTAEYMKASRFAVEYTSADGDKVALSFESVEYQKASMVVNAQGSEEDMKNLVKMIQDEYKSLQKELIDKIVSGIDGKEKVEKTHKPRLQIPEYWNAENTSQRIVDFATSFFDAFQGMGEEFLTKIKGAIEEGFKQARELLGNLPDEVNSLVQDTYTLTMKKLDEWAAAKGITPAQENSAA